MAFDGFLELKGIDGESKDSVHAGLIDIVSWNWGMTQAGSMNIAGGGGTSKVNIQDLSITKYVDKATPNLMKNCAKGDPLATGKMIIRKAGGEQLEYFTIEMTDIILTSVAEGGSGGDDALIETISLNFAHVVATYVEQDAPGGGLGAVEFIWDIEQNIDA